jgi:hypothetical protein
VFLHFATGAHLYMDIDAAQLLRVRQVLVSDLVSEAESVLMLLAYFPRAGSCNLHSVCHCVNF